MLGEFDWTNFGFAGTFIIGAILGSAATIRVMRWVLDYMKSRDKPAHKPEPTREPE